MPEDPRQKAYLAFHELPVGTDLGAVEYELSEKLVRRHLSATHQEPYPASGNVFYAPASILASPPPPTSVPSAFTATLQ